MTLTTFEQHALSGSAEDRWNPFDSNQYTRYFESYPYMIEEKTKQIVLLFSWGRSGMRRARRRIKKAIIKVNSIQLNLFA